MESIKNVAGGFAVGLLVLIFFMVGMEHGKALGKLNSLQEYERGYNIGWKEALYKRPVSNELEMVCLGLWTATLPEQK